MPQESTSAPGQAQDKTCPCKPTAYTGMDFGSQPDRTVIVRVCRDDDGSLTIVDMIEEPRP